MAYTDFTLEDVQTDFDLKLLFANLFETIKSIPIPETLRDRLSDIKFVPFRSEKSRSELIVMPILLAIIRLNNYRHTLFSGERLEGDASQKLTGECDFLLVNAPTSPTLSNPVFCVVEAKKQDLDVGMGQCAAQLLGVQHFNQRHGKTLDVIYGCVTTGETWQFMRLEGKKLLIDQRRYFLNELETILGILQFIIDQFPPIED